MCKFINSCFIRKNTPELINKLIDLGYESSWSSLDDKACIATSVYDDGKGTYTTIPEELFDSTNPDVTWNCANRIDCGTDENLFLTLAGLKIKEQTDCEP